MKGVGGSRLRNRGGRTGLRWTLDLIHGESLHPAAIPGVRCSPASTHTWLDSRRGRRRPARSTGEGTRWHASCHVRQLGPNGGGDSPAKSGRGGSINKPGSGRRDRAQHLSSHRPPVTSPWTSVATRKVTTLVGPGSRPPTPPRGTLALPEPTGQKGADIFGAPRPASPRPGPVMTVPGNEVMRDDDVVAVRCLQPSHDAVLCRFAASWSRLFLGGGSWWESSGGDDHLVPRPRSFALLGSTT